MFSRTPQPLPRSNRGSILLIALMISIIIALSLGSYLTLSRSNLVMSNRALYNSAAMNLAENGLEEAMYSVNKKIANPTYDWSGWSTDGTNAWRKLSGYSFDQNTTGETNVIVYNYLSPTTPKLVARSIVRLANQSQPVEKWVQVELKKTSRYALGLLARKTIEFSGNTATVDSWNSKRQDDGTLRASPVAYSSAVKHDKGSVASILTTVTSISVQNADIFGYVMTKGTNPSVGNNGLVGPFGTIAGTTVASRVQKDFDMVLEAQPTITTGTPLTAIGNGDLPITLGTSGSTVTYRIPSITATGNETKVLTIEGNVTIVLEGGSPGTEVLSFTGNSSINIANGATLTILAEGDIKIAGNGIVNANTQAKACTIIGTGENIVPQKIDITGNGNLKAVIDAPNAAVTIRGNGDVSGSITGQTIVVTGSANFHYDESLAEPDSTDPFRIENWTELSSNASREPYRTNLSF